MLRLFLIAFALLASPAWAGCDNYTDGSLKTPAPRATICVGGDCTETTADFQCGNKDGAQYGYANGLRVDFDRAGKVAAKMDGALIDTSTLTCTEIDEGACFGSLQ